LRQGITSLCVLPTGKAAALHPEWARAHDGDERWSVTAREEAGVDWLAVGLWTGALAGTIAVAAAVVLPHRRRAALLVSAALFLPIGVLGILSIGIFFLIAAVVCVTVALLHKPRGTHPTSSPAA
jgi:hypothetical protein